MGAKFFYRNIDLVYFVNNKLINNNLINQKDRMLLSFSGGQDSICFVFILNQLSSQLELDITFFWCHHLWQTDSFYLMQQITKLGFLLQFNSCFPIPLNSISSELLARKWRQRCSYRVSLFYNYSKICLAHTFNDKVENVFLNFIRGTGLIGLAPLRWTQCISKSNITSEKHLFRHNYLNNSCFATNGTNLTNRRFVPFVVKHALDPERVKGYSKKAITNDTNFRFGKFGCKAKHILYPKTNFKSIPLDPLQSKALHWVKGSWGYEIMLTRLKSCTASPLPSTKLCFGKGYKSSICTRKQLLNCRKSCYIVRPLLSISRIELNKICYFWKLPIYPDKSNQKVKFFRNRVRGQLLPTIKLFFNLNIENIFLQLAKIIETEDYCLTQIMNEFTKNTDVYHTMLDI